MGGLINHLLSTGGKTVNNINPVTLRGIMLTVLIALIGDDN